MYDLDSGLACKIAESLPVVATSRNAAESLDDERHVALTCRPERDSSAMPRSAADRVANGPSDESPRDRPPREIKPNEEFCGWDRGGELIPVYSFNDPPISTGCCGEAVPKLGLVDVNASFVVGEQIDLDVDGVGDGGETSG